MFVVLAVLALLILGCGGSGPPPPPKLLTCGKLGDTCAIKMPCCHSVNGLAIECFDGVCEYR